MIGSTGGGRGLKGRSNMADCSRGTAVVRKFTSLMLAGSKTYVTPCYNTSTIITAYAESLGAVSP